MIKIATGPPITIPIVAVKNIISAFGPSFKTPLRSVLNVYSADSTGGGAIKAGEVYTQYGFDGDFNAGPIYYYYRVATGATVVKGTNTTPDFTTGPYVAGVQLDRKTVV